MSNGYDKIDRLSQALQMDDERWLYQQQQRFIREQKKLSDRQVLDSILDGSIKKMKEE
jgi:hypothetical protein